MSLRVLFTGYAPVHFVCFRPLYERLSRRADVAVTLSGGTRRACAGGYAYDASELYGRFALPPGQVLPVEAIRELDFDVMFASHTRLIRPRRVDRTVQIFHGISFRNRALRPENMGCDHYFVIGPYMRRRLAEAGWLRDGDGRALPIGFMKTDRLLDGSIARAEVLARLGFDGARPVLLYAPTGARQNSLELMGEAVIEALLASGRYDLLVKPHDHPKNVDIDWFARLARFDGAHCRIVREADIVPMMAAADLLLSDASSAANEYALLDRPIVFLDTPQLIDNASRVDHSMLDLATWGRRAGSAVVARPGQVCGAVRRSLEHPGEKSALRRALVSDLFYNPGRATDAATAWFEREFIGARAAA